MSTEDEIYARRKREADRWWNSLLPHQKREFEWIREHPLEDPWSCWAIMSGFARLDETGHLVLTGAGELYLYQLKLCEWMEKKRLEKLGLPKPKTPKQPSMFD